MSSKPKIVVLGAGYAGLRTARRLASLLSSDEADIVLVNKHNYHYEATWLHEVAAGTLKPNQARFMISDVLNPNRIRLIYDEVQQIVQSEQRVLLKNGEITYDYLVVALGFESNTFGINGMEEHAFSIEDIESSRLIREHIELQFAKYSAGETEDEHALTIVVGGAGFTGIELLGELAERIPKLCRKYDVDRKNVRVINVEAMDRILPMFTEELVEYATEALESRGIEFELNTQINECKADRLIVGEENREIKAGTIIWTGGVMANSILAKSEFTLNRGKVEVDDFLRSPEDGNVYVLGDCAAVIDEKTGKPYPPTAQIAIQHGDTCAKNIRATMYGEPLEKFEFVDRGTVASLGVSDGIGSVFSDTNLKGKVAASMKTIVDNRSVFMLGGTKMLLKKGKLRFF